MKLLAFLFLALCLHASNSHAHLSARRLPDESFEVAKARSQGLALYSQNNPSDLLGSGPESLARPMGQLKIADIPEVANITALSNQFDFIRDTFFIKDANTSRRLTWLYPDDGCYARAELAAEHLIENNAVTPKKIFAFGDLHATTKNAPAGYVEWWYHVAVVYRVGNSAYVLDPALNPHQPLTLAQWGQAIGDSGSDVKYAICSKDAFDPDSACLKPSHVDENMAEQEQRGFLPEEWNRLLELGRDPNKELGNQPPWL